MCVATVSCADWRDCSSGGRLAFLPSASFVCGSLRVQVDGESGRGTGDGRRRVRTQRSYNRVAVAGRRPCTPAHFCALGRSLSAPRSSRSSRSLSTVDPPECPCLKQLTPRCSSLLIRSLAPLLPLRSSSSLARCRTCDAWRTIGASSPNSKGQRQPKHNAARKKHNSDTCALCAH